MGNTTDTITPEATTVLADSLFIPLQIAHYLITAFEKSYHIGKKPLRVDTAKLI